VFENGVVDVVEIFCLAQLKAWPWAKYKKQRVYFSFSINTCVLMCAWKLLFDI